MIKRIAGQARNDRNYWAVVPPFWLFALDVYSLQVKPATRKSFGYKSAVILTAFISAWSLFEYYMRYRENLFAFLSETGWIYLALFSLYQFFFFKLVSISDATIEIVKVLNSIRRKQEFQLVDVRRIVIRTGPALNSMVVFTKDAQENRIELALNRFKLRQLRDALLAKGMDVHDFI